MIGTSEANSGLTLTAPLPEQKPKTILFFNHTARMGGGEIALLHLVQTLDQPRYKPVVVLSADGPLCTQLAAAGIETHVLPLDDKVLETRKDSIGVGSLTRVVTVGRSLAYTWRLARFIRQSGADIVHTNSLKADVLGGIAARLARVPVIWHVRDRIAEDYLPRPAVQGFRLLSRLLPQRVIANSHATHRTLCLPAARQGVNKLPFSAVVHDGIKVEDNPPPVRRNASAPVRIGLVGRISPWKGQHIFLQAAALVRKRFPDATFQIVGAPLFGEEAYEAEVKALAMSLNLTDCVEFTGFRKDVGELMAAMDILVHASVTGEPFGQVVVEGMLAGKPVVATNGGGVPEIVVEGETGLLVPMGDAPAMAAAIEILLDDPARARRMGEAGRQRVQERFAIEHTARKVEKVYDSL